MLGRRNFLGTVGATAAVLAAARTLGGAGRTGAGTEPLAAAGVHPKARFGACEVVSLENTKDGAVSVRLADSAGQPFEVELLGYDSRTPGVARAGSLGVYLNNKGRGSTATIEEHGLAAMALASHLARRQVLGAKLPVLPTLAERSRRGDKVSV
jgi:hypothetical protein